MTNDKEPHAERLADWITQKMTGESVWSSKIDDRADD
jgi:hypothetical protein